jgi:hypothetical protein
MSNVVWWRTDHGFAMQADAISDHPLLGKRVRITGNTRDRCVVGTVIRAAEASGGLGAPPLLVVWLDYLGSGGRAIYQHMKLEVLEEWDT